MYILWSQVKCVWSVCILNALKRRKKIPAWIQEKLTVFLKNPSCSKCSLRKAGVSPRSSPLRVVSRGGTSATQRRTFYADDVNQCLHNKFSSRGVSDASLFNFTFLLVDFGKVLCSSANELQQNSNASSREDYIPQILAVLLEMHRDYIWPLRPFVCHS